MARFQIRRPKNPLPAEIAIWHGVMGEEEEVSLCPSIGGVGGVDFRGFSVDTNLHCPEIGYTTIINSCAHCSVGKSNGCGALEAYGQEIGLNILTVIYDYVLIAQKSKKMPAKKKPKLVVEINPETKDQGTLLDLTVSSGIPINPKHEYRPVVRRYTVKVELVTKGSGKKVGDFPKSLVMTTQSQAQATGTLGTCKDLIKRDYLHDGNFVYELGNLLEFQLRLEKLPERKTKAAVTKKKKKRGRPRKS